MSHPKPGRAEAPSYLPHVDGLRAIAICAVLLFHAFPKALPGGFLGVDVFFVISGFLIGGIVLRECEAGTFTVARFYQRRVRRIFPALLTVLAFCLLVGWTSLFDAEFLRLGSHALAGALGLANWSAKADSGYFSFEAESNPLLHLWSLGVEEQFYLVLPPLMLIFAATRRRLTIAFWLILLASLWLCIDFLHTAPRDSRFYLPQYRAWELMAGVLLACAAQGTGAPRTLLPARWHTLASALGLALVGWALAFTNADSPVWLANGAAVAGTLLLIAASGSRINRTVLASAPFVLVGLISYPLYLWHWPLLVFGKLLVPEPQKWLPMALLVLAFGLSYLTWRFIEKPVRSGRLAAHSPAWLGVLMVACAGFAAAVVWQDGRMGWAQKTDPLAFQSVRGLVIRPIYWPWMEAEKTPHSPCRELYWGKDAPADLNVYCSDPLHADPAVVIIGDSHATHLYEGVVDYYRRLGQPGSVLALAVNGCSPFSEGTSCSATYERVFALVAKTPSVRTVIFGEYIPGMRLNNRPSWVQKARDRMSRLSAEGRKVVLMLDVPETGKNPRLDCYDRPLSVVAHAAAQRCAIPRQAYEANVPEYRPKAAEATRGIGNVHVFDLAALLCDQGACRGQAEGRTIYRDSNHLNVFGSLYVSRFFDWERAAAAP